MSPDFSKASKDFHALNPHLAPLGKLPNSEPKRDAPPALARVAEGKEGGIPRVTLRFTGHRVRPLDPDNFAGSVKDLIDGLRAAGIIVGDEPWRIRLHTEQVKVAHFADEKTEIQIDYL